MNNRKFGSDGGGVGLGNEITVCEWFLVAVKVSNCDRDFQCKDESMRNTLRLDCSMDKIIISSLFKQREPVNKGYVSRKYGTSSHNRGGLL